MSMFNFLIKKKINSAFDNNKRKHSFRQIGAINNVLILFSYEDWAEISLIAQDLTNKGKKVLLWTVQSNNKSNHITLPSSVRVIQKNELSLSNILNSSVISEFKVLEYDTLIDLSTYHDNILRYLLALNSSDFSIGITELEYKAYDLTVLKQEKTTLSETYDQLKFYLNNVR